MIRTTPVNLATTVETDLGWILIWWKGATVKRLAFGYPSEPAVIDACGAGDVLSEELLPEQSKLLIQLSQFAAGDAVDFSSVKLVTSERTFSRRVVNACRKIPRGQTRTYAQLAKSACSPRAARAVGNIMANNSVPLIIPCHRVVASNSLGGFTAPSGLQMKRRLLAMESAK